MGHPARVAQVIILGQHASPINPNPDGTKLADSFASSAQPVCLQIARARKERISLADQSDR